MNEQGQRIREVRGAAGLTNRAFADALGISSGHVSGIERGQTQPSDLLLLAIALRFSVSERWLRTGEGPMRAPESRPAEHDPELADLLDQVATWWGQADEDERTYLRVALRRAVPELRLDIKRKRER